MAGSGDNAMIPDAAGPSAGHDGLRDEAAEWLEADGSGGFASGTVGGIRTRRYHALLLCATTPPTGRMVLVNGVEAWIGNGSASTPLSTQLYAPDVVFPDGRARLAGFTRVPWPTWHFKLPDGGTIVHEVFVAPASCETVLRWRFVAAGDACGAAANSDACALRSGSDARKPPADNVSHRFIAGDNTCDTSASCDPHATMTSSNASTFITGPDARRLSVRLLLSGRDYHALHHENAAFRFDADVGDGHVSWRPYHDVPAVTATTSGTYEHAPEWYRNFLYTEERDRGMDDTEDLASPGVFTFDLSGAAAATIVLRAGALQAGAANSAAAALAPAEQVRRAACGVTVLHSAESYLVSRGAGRTVIAGFPWFTDWGRDTFIAMRGLVLAPGHLDVAQDILCAWAGCVSEGMLPNRFPDGAGEPVYNAVDASLWFIVAVDDFLTRCEAARHLVQDRAINALRDACEAILAGYTAGTRFGIGADHDGLLAAGVRGVQLTWMDAKTGDHVVTPRIGKPVEVQALWINALRIAARRWSAHWGLAADQAQQAFAARFILGRGGLPDVVDANNVAGDCDFSVRPNQIFAVGGLPYALLDGAKAAAVVDVVEARLLTPLGLRTLSPDDPAYVGQYLGGLAARDGAYHQGTAWPWLMGPFVDAWLAVRGRTAAAKTEARVRFLTPLMAHLERAGLGHVSEIVDGDAPHTPRGCPFQAWSLGELIRIRAMLDVSY